MATKETVLGSSAGPAIMSSQAGQPVVLRGTYELTAADAEDNTLSLRVVKLPAQHRIVGLTLLSDDLDSATAILLDVGLEDTIGATTSADVFADASTLAQAGGVADLMSVATMEVAAVDNDRYITVAVATAAGTGVAGGVSVILTTVPELSASFDGNAS